MPVTGTTYSEEETSGKTKDHKQFSFGNSSKQSKNSNIHIKIALLLRNQQTGNSKKISTIRGISGTTVQESTQG